MFKRSLVGDIWIGRYAGIVDVRVHVITMPWGLAITNEPMHQISPGHLVSERYRVYPIASGYSGAICELVSAFAQRITLYVCGSWLHQPHTMKI